MDTFFKDFGHELQLIEEKLEILSEWHKSKNHIGATEIAEDCNSVISQLWVRFYKLSEAYKKRAIKSFSMRMLRTYLEN